MKRILKKTIEENNQQERTVVLCSEQESIEVAVLGDKVEIHCLEIEEYGEEFLKYRVVLPLDIFKQWTQAIQQHLRDALLDAK